MKQIRLRKGEQANVKWPEVVNGVAFDGPGILTFVPDGKETESAKGHEWIPPNACPRQGAERLSVSEITAHDFVERCSEPPPTGGMRKLIEINRRLVDYSLLAPAHLQSTTESCYKVLQEAIQAAEAELAGEQEIKLEEFSRLVIERRMKFEDGSIGVVNLTGGREIPATGPGRFAIRRLPDPPKPERVRPWLLNVSAKGQSFTTIELLCRRCHASNIAGAERCEVCHVPFGEPRQLSD